MAINVNTRRERGNVVIHATGTCQAQITTACCRGCIGRQSSVAGASPDQTWGSALGRALEIRPFLMTDGVRSTRMDVRALGQTSAQGVTPDRVDILVQKQ